MVLKTLSITVVLLVLLFGFSAGHAAEECGPLISGRCENCHYKTRICQALGKKSRSRWKRTVKAMVKKGALLSGKEQKILVRCLSKPDPEVVRFCQPGQPPDRNSQGKAPAGR